MSQQRVRPATVKTRTLRAGAGLGMEAERSEGILGLRNGFTFPDRAERRFQVVGQG